MVHEDECTAHSIIEAMTRGDFYATQGPEILDWGRDGNEVYFECSPCAEVHFITYPTRGTSIFAKDGEVLTKVRYTLKGGEKYVRVECIDEKGKSGWTNPFFFNN